MTLLSSSLAAWGKPEFEKIFKQEVEALDCDSLPLDQSLTLGSAANADNLGVMLLMQHATESTLQIKAGVFFTSVIAGCNCADDPTPVEENNEYCELMFKIDRDTSITKISPA